MDTEDNDLLLICTDNDGVWDLLWSCWTFVSCVIENSLRVLVQANRSCCIALWIQLRVGGAQMAVFMCFLCWLAFCWVWCGLQRGEAKRTNTFLLKILLQSEHFKQLSQLLCHWRTFCMTILGPDIFTFTLVRCTHWPITSPALCLIGTVVSPSLAPLLQFSLFLGSSCGFSLPLFS